METEQDFSLPEPVKERLREVVFNGELKAIIDASIGYDPDLKIEVESQ